MPSEYHRINFDNTEIAFNNVDDKALKDKLFLFRMMNISILVKMGSFLAIWALKFKMPFVKMIIRKTIFEQFCGGETLLQCQSTIDKLNANNCLTILDYGAEGNNSEEAYNKTMNEILKSIDFASANETVPVVSCKMTGLARFGLLEEISNLKKLSKENLKEYKIVLKRLDAICHAANSKGVGVFIDAEESWIQDAIDHMTMIMMRRYNSDKVIVYNTFQLYRTDRLDFLKVSFEYCQKHKFFLGAKLVRGAYMEKENNRAKEHNYSSLIHSSKADTDKDFDAAVKYCFERFEHVGLCVASHNEKSNQFFAKLIHDAGVQKSHPHLNFCQLYGMGDNMSFNLSKLKYNVAKYVPYGKIEEVIPYLLRRAQENTSVSGEASRELKYVQNEIKRRRL